MRTSWTKLIAYVGLVVVVLGFAPAAGADIIVVEGKIAKGLRDPVQTPGSAAATTPEPGEGEIPGDMMNPTTGAAGEGGEADLSDLDTVPVGYECDEIGAGLELCEPEDETEGPPEGMIESGGAVDPLPMMTTDCSAGGGTPWWLAAIGFVLFGVWTRRRG